MVLARAVSGTTSIYFICRRIFLNKEKRKNGDGDDGSDSRYLDGNLDKEDIMICMMIVIC